MQQVDVILLDAKVLIKFRLFLGVITKLALLLAR